MTLHPALSCPRVIAWLFGMSLVALVSWWIGLVVLALTSGGEISRKAVEIMSYITLAGFSGIGYTAVLRNSKWFFTLRPMIRWTASFLVAAFLTCGFLILFQIGFSFYAGW
jgi:hypothetical protein